jgi:hypothetical protein
VNRCQLSVVSWSFGLEIESASNWMDELITDN